MLRRIALLAGLVVLAVPAPARAEGGRYVLVGGTKAQRQTVVSALEASSFNWSLVPALITITIAPEVDSQASPGQIWLDADLLDSGTFAWGVVQHEYAHQVDFFLLDDTQRQRLLVLLGGIDWCFGVPGLAHGLYGCERFASTLAWSYWPSPNNCMKPQVRGDESNAMPPRRFRALVDALLLSRSMRLFH